MVALVSMYNLKGPNKFDAVVVDRTITRDLDFAHCGTGYIHVLDKTGKHDPFTSQEIVPWRVPSLHLVMYASLAFIGAPMVYTPFTVADVVSTWIGETPYPSAREGLVYEQRNEGKSFVDGEKRSDV